MSKHRNLLERKLEESFGVGWINGRYEYKIRYRPKPVSYRPPRDTPGAFIRLTPFGIFVGDNDYTFSGFWSPQGYGQFPYSDAIWLGEWFFDKFTLFVEDEDREIIDIDEF